MPRPLVRDRDLALYGGLALWLVGTVMLWDAWERRGRRRPFTWKLAGAVVPG